MVFGSAIHKRSSYTRARANPFSGVSQCEAPRCVRGRRDVPQTDRSNEQRSRKSRGTSSLFLQLLRPEDTTGVLGFTLSTICHRREAKGPDRPAGNIPKIQDGFTGPGTSLIAGSFLPLRRRTYTKTAAQVANVPS